MSGGGNEQTVRVEPDRELRRAGLELYDHARGFLATNPYESYGGQMVAGLDPMQQQAAGLLSAGLQSQDPAAMNAASRLSNFQAPTVDPSQAGIAQSQYAGSVRAQDVAAPQAAMRSAGYGGDVNAQQVQAGGFLSGPGIGAYMDPYNDQVVDAALSDIERSRQLANQAGARSADASTYGGDRNALIEAETNRGFGDVAARTAAQLRSQGFGQAASLYGQDLNRQMQAGMANQSAGLQAGLANQSARQQAGQFNAGQFNQGSQFNAGLGMQAGLANQQAGLTAGLANQGTLQGLYDRNAAFQNQGAQFNASLGQQAGLADQQAALQGAQTQLGAAGLLGQLDQQQFGNLLAGSQALNQFGTQARNVTQQGLAADYARWQDAQNDPYRRFQFQQGMLSGIPGGQTQYINPGSNQGAGFAGGAMTGAGIGSMFGPWGAGVGAGLGGLLGLF